MKVIIVHPEHCRYCTHIYNNFKHIVDAARNTNTVYIDIASSDAIPDNIISTLEEKPDYNFFGTGHGSPTVYTAEHMQPVLTLENTDLMKDRHVYLHSCLTGGKLGPSMMENGAKSFAGFTIEWMWVYSEDENGDFKYPDPYDDPIAKYFFIAANTYPIELLSKGIPDDAYNKTIGKYNEMIDEIFNSDIENAGQIIGLLAVDRNGMILLTGRTVQIPVLKILTYTTITLVGITLILYLPDIKDILSKKTYIITA